MAGILRGIRLPRTRRLLPFDPWTAGVFCRMEEGGGGGGEEVCMGSCFCFTLL